MTSSQRSAGAGFASVGRVLRAVRHGWYALVPALATLALGVWGIGATGPWFDERFTMMALTDGLFVKLYDTPLVPYYGLMWVWSFGGNLVDIGWLRFFSVVTLALGSAAVAVTARRMESVLAGFSAGMLVAIVPGLARYGQEARTYALAAFLVALATLMLVNVMSGGRRVGWVGYGVAMGLAGVVLPISFAAIPAHAVILMGFPDWRRSARDWLAACLFLLPVLAIEFLIGLAGGGGRDWLAVPGIADLPAGISLLASSEYTASFGVLLAVVAALSRVGLRWLGGLGLSVLSIWVVSVTMGSWWTARSFIPLTGILCVAAGLSLARTDWVRALVVLAILAVVSFPDHRAIREPGSRGVEPAEVAALVDQYAQSGDVLRQLPTSGLLQWSVAHYLPGDPRGFTSSSDPASGRYWEMSDVASCPEFQEWSVTGGGRLRLCS